ncbi:hypothetical protein [Streptomyces xanthophaeus]|uniref:hypothetical protein n=1 Tax=Streptomyces xanthophaeus TaxID=67385 RepID=UPI00371B033B
MGRMTAGVNQAVVANMARTNAAGTDRWADLLKETVPEGLRGVIVASLARPDIAAAMGLVDFSGVDVAGSSSTPTRRSGRGPGRRRRHRGRGPGIDSEHPVRAFASAVGLADARVPAPAAVAPLLSLRVTLPLLCRWCGGRSTCGRGPAAWVRSVSVARGPLTEGLAAARS